MAASSSFKLRCQIFGHEKDVRGLSPSYFPEGAIVSTSRDITARVWVPNEQDPCFTEGHCMSGHNNFVTCVCVTMPSDAYPQGLIITGSQDKDILAYTLDSPQPVFKLTGHTDTVCSLASGKFGTLLSGSWDKTAKVWLNQKNVLTMSGHEAAVWSVAVMPEGGNMLTASADKTIKLWKAGKCQHTFIGHEDCVRGLAVLSSTEFLSCGNDATVRRWMISGECAQIYRGHESFIYTIAVMPNGQDFVTGGEDRTVRVWHSTETSPVQTLAHPAQSVWAVCVLPNGDIVTGCSDGVVRVFTLAPERTAEEAELKEFEDQVSKCSIPTQIGDIKTDELLGPDALLNPGKRDGQTLMIRDGNQITAHQWSASEGRWQKVGDVVGGSGGSGGKKTYMGKEYDYVFDVDIQEDKPPLKLPYNTADDPWMAASKFLGDNDLSPMYLDQVVKFIQAQTHGTTIGTTPLPPNMDPFTGNSNGSNAGSQHAAPQPPPKMNHFNPDPFTGGDSSAPKVTPGGDGVAGKVYFPESKYISFEAGNPKTVIGKLITLNAGLVDTSYQVKESNLHNLEGLMNGSASTPDHFALLRHLLQWPKDSAWPALDVLRMAIRHEPANVHFFGSADSVEFLLSLWPHLSPESTPASQMLMLRTLSNAFLHTSGRQLLLEHRDAVITAAINVNKDNKNVAIALASLLVNYAVVLRGITDSSEAVAQMINTIAEISQRKLDNEANFRLLVCIGTLIQTTDSAMALALSLGLENYVESMRGVSDHTQLGECSKQLAVLLK